MMDYQDSEALTFGTAIGEMRIAEADARHFQELIGATFCTGLAEAANLRPRKDWRQLLGPVHLLPCYSQWNALKRDAQSIAFRAVEAYDYVSMMRDTIQAKKAIPEPKIVLKKARDEILQQLEDPIRALCRSPFRVPFEQLILACPEFSDALLSVSRGRTPTKHEMLIAVNSAIDQRGKNGRPRNIARSDAYQLLREHYTWLTGRAPSWTNALGVPEGDTVDFARSVYSAAGIDEITDLMLRPERAKRSPRRLKQSVTTA